MTDEENSMPDGASPKFSNWHHSPAHSFEPNLAYIITAGTLYKRHYFRSDDRLTLLQAALLEALYEYQWRPQAWAFFSNHYHCLALAPEQGRGKDLKTLLQRVHSETARKVNTLDDMSGRRVWYQYRDTPLTYDKSYYARLKYTHHNAVKHGLVREATQYPFCSAAWFEQTAPGALHRKIASFKWDTVNIEDEYDVEWHSDKEPPELRAF